MAQKPKPQKKIPQRKCVGCAERREKRELIRVVRLPDQGGVVLDDTGKKAGRGAYLCRNPACLKKALKARRLQNALECEIPPEVCEALTNEITKAAQSVIQNEDTKKVRPFLGRQTERPKRSKASITRSATNLSHQSRK